MRPEQQPGFLAWAIFSRYADLRFRLHQDLVYISRAGEIYVVKAGYISDLGSVPRPLWPLLPPHEYPSAYFLHDLLYATRQTSREKADGLLREALLKSNAPPWKAELIYKGVRVGGSGHWPG